MPLPKLPALYSQEEIEQYFDYLGLLAHERLFAYSGSPDERLQFLKQLIHRQLMKVPFENLALHYSPDHTISLDVPYLFQKCIKQQNGRGGYCMENNTFFAAILRSLKFDVVSVGARVSNLIKPGNQDKDLSELEFGGW